MSAPMSTSVLLTRRADLRDRQPHPDHCLQHPDCCGECAWGFVDPSSPGYQPGLPLPDDIESSYEIMPGGYDSHCGEVQIVRHCATGVIYAIRNGRLYVADTESTAFIGYREAMGLVAA